jgi:hypothetical protein
MDPAWAAKADAADASMQAHAIALRITLVIA